jgi:phage gp37-like protein
MLAEIEDGLVAEIKKSDLGRHLRAVGSLPDLAGDSLVGRFATDAPAIYIALSSFPVENRLASVKYGVACVARNSRGQKSARHGDGHVIGLLPLLDAAMALLDGIAVCDAFFTIRSCDLETSDALYQRGVYVGVIHIESLAPVPVDGLDLDGLSEFMTFDSQYDIESHESTDEHGKWLDEPPDHASSAPELIDHLTVRRPV